MSDRGPARGKGDGGKGGLRELEPPRLTPPRVNRDVNSRHTPWLLIRDAVGDAGARPLASGAVFWESPDVWVVSSQGVNQPVVGQANQVFARVTNLGWQYATGVLVKFWWANPSLAITETTATLIGVGHADIPSGWSVVVPCPEPWFPVEENGGHECLIAEAYIQKFDPLIAPMDPVEDRHVGQKNEQLVLLQAGQSFHIGVQAANVFDFAQAMAFEVRPLLLEALHPLLATRGLNTRELRAPAAALPLSFEIDSAAPVYAGPSAVFAKRLASMAQRRSLAEASLTAPVQIARAANFDPWEMRTLQISGRAPSGARPGDTFAFRIVQRIGPIVTGGYTVNAVVID